ncbi:hypothetical protein [Mucilaginibacter aquatilis]|uniref:Uncharacterized protein n=1 Tax=Mucilaginibacter aquatilis TaxID=1517760 RepID=A0A6I4IQJ7_9SPHI|nr:hypothetical protein [Mucilaginibacter aquatilis]MVN91264.1 hypothetical protein [Mucilaginibacter aquatilis]
MAKIIATYYIMRLVLLAAVFFKWCVLDVSAQEIRANTPREKKILTLIANLPEVQQRAKQIREKSGGKTEITLMISAQPELYIPYYQVNVNDNAPTYLNYYQFAVDPKTFEIFYYDAKINRQYNLAEWRKQRKGH